MKRFASMTLALLLLFVSCAFAESNYSIGTYEPDEPVVQPGDIIRFGSYEQDNVTGDGKEPIEWIVLDVDGASALVISRYGLANKQFNSNSGGQTWSSCSLRTWLNGSFLKSAFNAQEREAILYTEVQEGIDQCDSSHAPKRLGSNTRDKIFVLSYAEAIRYLRDRDVRLCIPTAYATGQGGNKSDTAYLYGSRTCWYWLRSPAYQNNACCVDWDGTYATCYISHNYGVVRPCMWVVLDEGPEYGI